MKCRFHPDREARVTCQKMETGYCQECLDTIDACTDPTEYCKFRPQCIIWEFGRAHRKETSSDDSALENNTQGE